MSQLISRPGEFDLDLKFESSSALASLQESGDEVYQQNGKLNVQYLIKNAKVLLAVGDTKLAKRIFKTIIEAGEVLGVAYSGLGAAFEIEGKDELAIKAYREAIIYDPSFGTLMAVAELYIKKQDFQAAVGPLLRANTLSQLSDEQEFLLHKSLGNCYMHLGQLNNAEAHYRKAFEINSTSDALHVNIGSLALKKQDSATALLHFKEALRINGKNASAQLGVGLAQLVQGNKQLAHDAFANTLRIDIKDASALYNLVKCAYELKTYEAACEILRDYTRSNTVNSHILFCYAGVLYHQSKLVEAREECEKLLQLNPEHAGAVRLQEMINKKLTS